MKDVTKQLRLSKVENFLSKSLDRIITELQRIMLCSHHFVLEYTPPDPNSSHKVWKGRGEERFFALVESTINPLVTPSQPLI